jgi:hypothetical protein
MLNVFMISVVMLSVVMLSDVMLGVTAPKHRRLDLYFAREFWPTDNFGLNFQKKKIQKCRNCLNGYFALGPFL